jgi:signal transduction histidine kinase
MEVQRSAESGRTLGAGEGLHPLRTGARWQTLRQTTLTIASIAGFVAGVAATSAALAGFADAGVVFDSAQQTVVSVSPIGFAWRDGVRPGQRIVSFTTALESGGWHLETTNGGPPIVSTEDVADEGLRDSLPIALVALAAGALGVLFRNTHRHWVAPATCLALLAASVPLGLQGNPNLSTLSLGAAFLAPAIWLIGRLPTTARTQAVLVFATGALVAAWTVGTTAGLQGLDGVEGIRASLATGATLLVFGDRIVVPLMSRDPIPLHRPRAFDALAVAMLSGAALALVYYLAVSPIAVGIGVVIILVALPPMRRWTSSRLKIALFADIREQAAIDAAEEERARMARELHDVPLQHLSGVIRRLELRPDAQAVSDELRIIAGQLRTVATDLRPPVLDDLGLPAALSFLAEESSRDGTIVATDVTDTTGLAPALRPPADVELAIYRISQEAIGNALQHAKAKHVTIEGRIDADEVALAISDDGIGLRPDVARAAGRRGRLGLASMRRRASAIEADLRVVGTDHGTSIHIAWHR